jgi:hypothetical protein
MNKGIFGYRRCFFIRKNYLINIFNKFYQLQDNFLKSGKDDLTLIIS